MRRVAPLGLLAPVGVAFAAGLAVGVLIGGWWEQAASVRDPSLPAVEARDVEAETQSMSRSMRAQGRSLGSEESAAHGEESAAADLSLPLKKSLAGESLSSLPHEVVAAWDNEPEDSSPGTSRTLVLVVDGALSDGELEALLRDVRRSHRDAHALDVRVYDEARAATDLNTSDGGQEQLRHLVAEMKRMDRLGVDRIRVRGRSIEP